jgi:3-oxoacid CoA-transferase subunit A
MSKPASINKVVDSAAHALHDLFDGARIMSGGFGLCGGAENCITQIRNAGVKDLTIISNNCGNQGQGLAVLLQNRQVKKVICSFVGGNPDLEELLLNKAIEVELNPQGTLAERIRAGGIGLGGFFTPTGVGTEVAIGKEVRMFDREMIFESALTADFAIIRAHKADTYGNLRFYRTSQNFCPLMAMAAKICVVEAENIVPLGDLDPDDIHLPGIFVNRIFQGRAHKNVIEHLRVRDLPIPDAGK